MDLDELTNPTAIMPLIGKAMFTDGRTLDQVISPELYKKVLERAEKAGIAARRRSAHEAVDGGGVVDAPALKAAGFNASSASTSTSSTRPRRRASSAARSKRSPTSSIGSTRCRAALQEAMLKSVIRRHRHADLGNVKTIADAWARGDTATSSRSCCSARSANRPSSIDRLLVERNRNWVAPVEACIKAKTACFVVVGAAHLVGPDSLVALLQKKGYTVEQQ